MTAVDVTAPGKLLLLGIISVGLIAFIVWGDGDKTQAWVTLGLIVGYLIGNGAGARKGVEQAPVFTPAKDAYTDLGDG